MPRPYMALRKLMLIMDWNQEDIGRIIARDGKARCCKYVSDRLCGKQYFDTYDGYAILKAANLPDSEFTTYFPRNPLERVEL